MKQSFLGGILLVLALSTTAHPQTEGGWFGALPRAQTHGITMNGLKLGYKMKAVKAHLAAGCKCQTHYEGAGQYSATLDDPSTGTQTAVTYDQGGTILEISSRNNSAIERDGKTLFKMGDPADSARVLLKGASMPENANVPLSDQHGTLLIATESGQIQSLAMHH